jgi:hypothetical protein
VTLPDLPERTMQSLGWLIHGTDVINHEDTLLVALPEGGTWCVTNHELVELEERGYIDFSTDEHLTVTDRGQYWYAKWNKAATKKPGGGVSLLLPKNSKLTLRRTYNGTTSPG